MPGNLRYRARIDTAATRRLQQKLSDLTNPLTAEDAEAMGRAIVKEMKSLILSGISPIAGAGRFPAYKNPRRYPGNRKPHSPVNLHLSGEFLDDLGYRVVKARFGYAASIGFSKPLSRRKEQGHREGANGQPQRPVIPQPAQGERFVQRIQDVIRKTILAAIGRISRR